MRIGRKLPRTVIVAGAVTMMLAAGTGPARAAASKGGPTQGGGPAVGYTLVPVTRNGRTVWEERPTASLGLVTPAGLDAGEECILEAVSKIPFAGKLFGRVLGLGVLSADASAGASAGDLFLSVLDPRPFPECTRVIVSGHHKTR